MTSKEYTLSKLTCFLSKIFYQKRGDLSNLPALQRLKSLLWLQHKVGDLLILTRHSSYFIIVHLKSNTRIIVLTISRKAEQQIKKKKKKLCNGFKKSECIFSTNICNNL